MKQSFMKRYFPYFTDHDMNVEAYDRIMGLIYSEMDHPKANRKPDFDKIRSLVKATQCPYMLSFFKNKYAEFLKKNKS